MQHDEFIGRVQDAAHLPSRGDAERATRVVLETLGERLAGGLPGNVAAQLPPELGRHLEGDGRGERFDVDDFLARVSEREGVELPDATHHARSVLEILGDALPASEVGKVLDQLPADYAPLFAGSRGTM